MMNADGAGAKLVLILCVLGVPAVSQTPPRPVATLPDSTANLPVQKIGIDDLIGISVYDSPELTRTVRVAADGAIRLPMVKARIPVAGLLPYDVETVIAAQLTKEKVLVDPIVTVSVVESRSRPIVVSGAVKRPITFQASSQTSLLDALARAEGLAADAGPEILVSKAQTGSDGQTATLTQRISVKALIDAADPELNLQLQGGEQIRVPEAGRVYVVGNVRKPGAFVIHDASETSVLRVLALSEGLDKFAAKEAYIYRREGRAGKNEIPIELEKIMQRKAPDVPLQANDILYIPDNKGRRSLARVMESVVAIGGGAAVASIYMIK
ncbi:MAG TPA: polysaccharide biosynthesis/export family protein [Bryobacteraceae bacterium]|nr:polysaccharide biosynthesis/export family protein [Bryobacteraceae bacterium]